MVVSPRTKDTAKKTAPDNNNNTRTLMRRLHELIEQKKTDTEEFDRLQTQLYNMPRMTRNFWDLPFFKRNPVVNEQEDEETEDDDEEEEDEEEEEEEDEEEEDEDESSCSVSEASEGEAEK